MTTVSASQVNCNCTQCFFFIDGMHGRLCVASSPKHRQLIHTPHLPLRHLNELHAHLRSQPCSRQLIPSYILTWSTVIGSIIFIDFMDRRLFIPSAPKQSRPIHSSSRVLPPTQRTPHTLATSTALMSTHPAISQSPSPVSAVVDLTTALWRRRTRITTASSKRI